MVYLINTFSGIHGFIIADFIILLKMPARFYAMRKTTSARIFKPASNLFAEKRVHISRNTCTYLRKFEKNCGKVLHAHIFQHIHLRHSSIAIKDHPKRTLKTLFNRG